MSSDVLMRRAIDALWPEGSAASPAPGGDLDHLLDGEGANLERVRVDLATLANVRDPRKTPYLADLEREFGITPNVSISENVRRMTLASKKYKQQKLGTLDDIQAALDAAGFGVGGYGIRVFANDPPVDPALFTSQLAACYCGQLNAICGNQAAYCGIIGGFIIQSGLRRYTVGPAYFGCGMSGAYCGFGTALCGYFVLYNFGTVTPNSPADPWSWALVFFLAAGVTNTGSGITAVQFASIPQLLSDSFYDIILSIKPLHSWAAAAITFS